ncbi:MAG: KpsF/GutQ family sugar-phosphate isomerase [Pelagibacterales bacterium]|nr:KpsF/GutQ family sugar-phosphate isomerase [Pelagibacterales bacterium]
MKEKKSILSYAIETIEHQANSIKNLSKLLTKDFEKAVNIINNTKGRVIVSGIGKSAIIAQKIVATFNSTGTPSIFMHAADAIHGDLGLIQSEDVIICISKSGNTPEIKALVPFIKKTNNKLIAITGETNSYLSEKSDIVINSYVDAEACPNNLAPTTSTTAQLVIGDAIAVCLVKLRGFSPNDFAKYHPGGTLGKRLFLKVKDLIDTKSLPKVDASDLMKDVIIEISNKMLGITVVLDKNKIVGVITDGDLRRQLLKSQDISKVKANEIMSKNPKIINKNLLATEALLIMKTNKISQLIVAEKNKYVGVLHIQSLIKEGII